MPFVVVSLSFLHYFSGEGRKNQIDKDSHKWLWEISRDCEGLHHLISESAPKSQPNTTDRSIKIQQDSARLVGESPSCGSAYLFIKRTAAGELPALVSVSPEGLLITVHAAYRFGQLPVVPG